MANSQRARFPAQFGKNGMFVPANVCDGTLVVFVHGFRGKAVSTWSDFPKFVDQCRGCAMSDLLFYGYSSRGQQALAMATDFVQALNTIWADPGALGVHSLAFMQQRGKSEPWKKVVLIGHSLGAIIIRRALIDCLLDGNAGYDQSHWSRKNVMCLYAPAHKGARIIPLLTATFSPAGIPVTPVLRVIYSCLDDLEKDSLTLKELESDYDKLPLREKEIATAVCVLRAQKEGVVYLNRFGNDAGAQQINDRGHMGVCKPKAKFLDPVSKLCSVWDSTSPLAKL